MPQDAHPDRAGWRIRWRARIGVAGAIAASEARDAGRVAAARTRAKMPHRARRRRAAPRKSAAQEGRRRPGPAAAACRPTSSSRRSRRSRPSSTTSCRSRPSPRSVDRMPRPRRRSWSSPRRRARSRRARARRAGARRAGAGARHARAGARRAGAEPVVTAARAGRRAEAVDRTRVDRPRARDRRDVASSPSRRSASAPKNPRRPPSAHGGPIAAALPEALVAASVGTGAVRTGRQGRDEGFGDTRAVDGIDLTVPAGHLLRPRRPERRRQDDDPVDDRGTPAPRSRLDPRRRRGRGIRSARREAA